MAFTPEQLELLSKYVTDPTADVFAIKGMDGLVGAVYARYSRAPGGFKETLLKEFIQAGAVDAVHAQELIDRVLVAYGDDSVGELEGAHVSFEKVSAIGEKAVCDHRIGGAFIVQSTRYVYYDQPDDQGRFRYYRDPTILSSPLAKEFTTVTDRCFATYAELVPVLKAYLETRKPMGEAEYDINGDGKKEKFSDCVNEADVKAFKRTYTFDLRAKICDTLRVLLPLSTHHNVGVFGNGRFYQSMVSNFLTSPLREMQDMGGQAHAALTQIIPKYVKRAKRSDYAAGVETAMQKLTDELTTGMVPQPADMVSLLPLVTSESKRDIRTISAMLYAHCHLPISQLETLITKLPPAGRERIWRTYVGERQTRRDRPGRALEDGYPYTFDLLVTYQVFKDLQRHRMGTQLWQPFTPHLGYFVPDELRELKLESKLISCDDAVRALYDKLVAAGLRAEAQYAVLHGHKTRWVFGANDRALMHMLELRSTPQGHPEYRMVSQRMHAEIKKRSPWRADMMRFVDYADYYWSRADSEARQRVKERELDKKYRRAS
ncbi:MAG: hypothetical protein G01um101431_72 [Parcubacteria group bacterium Gr01-1014_31]|nr:MAG: hypothetical protein G01um101431_72 [Parcubacteria group bacterium Gr01-1014_31]